MLKRILVPLDGSEYAAAVATKAIRMAELTDAELRGLAILDEPAIKRPEPEPAGAAGFLEHKQEKRMVQAKLRAKEVIEAFLEQCKNHEVRVAAFDRTGDPFRVIVEESHQNDLIVLGQRTTFKFMTQEGYCKTMQDVLKASPRPVVIVPPELKASEGIWFATDGSNGAARSLQMFQMMGLPGKRKIHVIAISKMEAEAERRVDEAVGFLEAHGHDVDRRPVVSDEHPWTYLKRLMIDERPEVMVMGAYGTSGLKELFVGSVTHKLIQEAPVPLFVFH